MRVTPFSIVKALEAGDSTSLPSEKAYAAKCAVSYLEAEYERTFSVHQDGEKITVKRLT